MHRQIQRDGEFEVEWIIPLTRGLGVVAAAILSIIERERSVCHMRLGYKVNSNELTIDLFATFA